MKQATLFLLIFFQLCNKSKPKSAPINNDLEIRQKVYPWLTKEIWNNIKAATVKYSNDKHNGVDHELVMAVIDAESSGNVNAIGPRVRVRANNRYIVTQALGLMQIIPEFHYRFKNKTGLFEVKTNINIGVAYLSTCLRLAKGNLTVMLKNYNSGPNSSFYNWPYIKKILANSIRFKKQKLEIALR